MLKPLELILFTAYFKRDCVETHTASEVKSNGCWKTALDPIQGYAWLTDRLASNYKANTAMSKAVPHGRYSKTTLRGIHEYFLYFPLNTKTEQG